MARLVLANQATAGRRRAYFDCRDATDGLTPETGEAGGQPQISTNGGAFTNTGIGTLTHMGNGRYYADVTQAAVATAGDVIETRYKSANTAETPGDTFQVVAFDPDDTVRLGLTALPNAAAAASGGLMILGSNNTAAITIGALTVGAINGTTLTFSGAVAFQSTFAVTTSTSLAALSCTTLTASGAVAFQSTFATTGTTTFNAFTVTNALTVSGNTTFTGTTTHTGHVSYADGISIPAPSTLNRDAFIMTGNGTGEGFKAIGGAQGYGGWFQGGATSGGALNLVSPDDNTISITSTGDHHAILIDTDSATNATVEITNQNASGNIIRYGDGATTAFISNAGVFDVDITGNITGNLSGSVGSVTGAVGSVTGAVGSVTGNVGGNVTGSVGSVVGAVGSVTGNVGGNVTGSVGSVVGAVGSVTGNVGGNVTGSVGSLATQAKADVNAEVLDVVNTDTFAEPGQGSPAATTSLVAKIGYLYKAWRNKKTKTATASNLYADDGTTVDQKTTDSDDGTTATRGEQTTGP